MTQHARLRASATPLDRDLPTWNVRDLNKNGDDARLLHGGQVCILRIMRAAQLVLTK